MVTGVHKEYNASLPVVQQDKDKNWYDEIDANMLQFKQKIHGWIRDVENERDAAMKNLRWLNYLQKYVSWRRDKQRNSGYKSWRLRNSKPSQEQE